MNQDFRQKLSDLGLSPLNDSLYQTAFTHRSFLNESREEMKSNERMEFLGDSVLSFIVSSYLYQRRPEDEEGFLTNLRSFIVKTESLAKVSLTLSLGENLRMSKGEEMSGGKENTQLLANTFEAVLGAIYLDLGLEAATTFVHKTLIPLFSTEIELGPPKDSKSQLQELVQELTKTSPKYRILETIGPDHAKRFKVGVFMGGEEIGSGEGSSKQQAEEEAAKKALESLSKKNT